VLSVRQFKAGFFDRELVARALDKATHRALSKGGAFIRRRAKSSMPRRKKISVAGQPPSAHAGHVKDFLYFAYDHASRSVVVGPARLNKPDPNLLARIEHGGTATVRTIRFAARTKSGRLKKTKTGDVVYATRRSSTADSRTVTYKARPFMVPALAAEAPKLAELWRNSVQN